MTSAARTTKWGLTGICLLLVWAQALGDEVSSGRTLEDILRNRTEQNSQSTERDETQPSTPQRQSAVAALVRARNSAFAEFIRARAEYRKQPSTDGERRLRRAVTRLAAVSTDLLEELGRIVSTDAEKAQKAQRELLAALARFEEMETAVEHQTGAVANWRDHLARSQANAASLLQMVDLLEQDGADGVAIARIRSTLERQMIVLDAAYRQREEFYVKTTAQRRQCEERLVALTVTQERLFNERAQLAAFTRRQLSWLRLVATTDVREWIDAYL